MRGRTLIRSLAAAAVFAAALAAGGATAASAATPSGGIPTGATATSSVAASALTDTNTGSEHIFFAFGYGVYAVLAPSEQTHILKTVDDHADDAVAAVCAKRGDLCAFGTGAVASLVATMTSPQGTHAVPCLATEDYRLVLKGPGASKCVAHTES